MVECRICHYPIDKVKEKEGVDWIQPSRGWYYHKECYDTWKATPSTDDDWILMIFDFLARDLKVTYNYHMCKAQIEKFWKDNKINPKGIYFTLKYFYEIKHNSWDKSHGGLGIVPWVFNEAKSYWIEQERKKHGFIADIEQQAKEKVVVKITRKERNWDKYSLDDI